MANYLDSAGLSYVWDKIENLNEWMPKTAAAHNSIYRGKDITSKYNDGSLFTAISSGYFDDVFVGDYFTANISTQNWTLNTGGTDFQSDGSIWKAHTFRIMELDPRLYRGKPSLTIHHAAVMMDDAIATAPMNTIASVSGGYVGSKFYTTCSQAITESLRTTFTKSSVNHLVSHKEVLTNATDDAGNITGWDWYSEYWTLPSEIEVYGSQIMGAGNGLGNGGISYGQLAGFRLNPELVTKFRSTASSESLASWWLRDTVNSGSFAIVGYHGMAVLSSANVVRAIRPVIYID